MIGLTILELFFAETSSGKLMVSAFVLYTFVAGIGSFILALISLLPPVFWFGPFRDFCAYCGHFLIRAIREIRG